LQDQSKKPKTSPQKKIFDQQEKWILELRNEMNLGARRIQNELVYQHDFHVSLSTIQKVLKRHEVKPLIRPKRHKKI